MTDAPGARAALGEAEPRGSPSAPPGGAAREDLVAFEKRFKRELGFSLALGLLAFVCGFGPLLAAALLAGSWETGVIAWSAGGGLGLVAFVVAMPIGRRVARSGKRDLAARFLGVVLGLSAVVAGLFLVSQ